MEDLLPVHGFVLAGGRSSRMGVDKAMLKFRGRPMVEIALEKLRTFCADVSIAGNREDLRKLAAVVVEKRIEAGPAAGIEAGLTACRHEWAFFVPVDVPLVPEMLMRRWAASILETDRQSAAGISSNLQGAYLSSGDQHHPTFCLVRRRLLPVVSQQLDYGHRSLRRIFEAAREQSGAGSILKSDALQFAPDQNASQTQVNRWFHNINTPDHLMEAECGSVETP